MYLRVLCAEVLLKDATGSPDARRAHEQYLRDLEKQIEEKRELKRREEQYQVCQTP